MQFYTNENIMLPFVSMLGKKTSILWEHDTVWYGGKYFQNRCYGIIRVVLHVSYDKKNLKMTAFLAGARK